MAMPPHLWCALELVSVLMNFHADLDQPLSVAADVLQGA